MKRQYDSCNLRPSGWHTSYGFFRPFLIMIILFIPIEPAFPSDDENPAAVVREVLERDLSKTLSAKDKEHDEEIFFSKGFFELWSKYMDAHARDFDADVFIGAQDLSELKIKRIYWSDASNREREAAVTIAEMSLGAMDNLKKDQSAERVILFNMVKENGNWKIDDIRWSDGFLSARETARTPVFTEAQNGSCKELTASYRSPDSLYQYVIETNPTNVAPQDYFDMVACECRMQPKLKIKEAVTKATNSIEVGLWAAEPIHHSLTKQEQIEAEAFSNWIIGRGPRPRMHGSLACDYTRVQ